MAVFDNYAKSYDEWYTDKKGSFVDMVETDLVFKTIKIEKGMKVLDAGCGTGNFSVKLAKMGCRVTGVDISDEMLGIAKKKAADLKLDIDFKKMDIYDLKFEDNEFDAALSMAAFEFLEDGQKALQGLLRVVKKGGQVLVASISKDSAWGEFYTSEAFKNTVYKYAKFKTLTQMKGWEKEKLVDFGECLFIPPLADENEFNYETENRLSKKTKGGFVCALWKK